MKMKRSLKQTFALLMTMALVMTGMKFGTLTVSAQENGDEPQYNYWFEQNGTLVGVPGWCTDINKTLAAWGPTEENPDGEELSTTITNVSVEGTEGSEDVVTVTQWDDNNGWSLVYNKMGEADVTLTYTKLDGAGESDTHTFHISVRDIAYYTTLDSSTGINMLLPGAELDLYAQVMCDGYNSEEEYSYPLDTSDTVTELNCTTEGYSDYLELSAGSEPNSFHIKAKDVEIEEEKGFDFLLTAKKDGEVVAEKYYYIGITNDYYQIHMNEEAGTDILPVGNSLTVKPQLYHYIKGEEAAQVSENVTYSYETNTEVLSVSEEGEGYTLTRLQGGWADIRFIAEITEGDEKIWVADYRMGFQEDRYTLCFTNLREEWGTFIYTDETMRLNVACEEEGKTIPASYDVDWQVVTVNENMEPTENSVGAECYNADKEGITLYGEKLAYLPQQNIWSVFVQAIVKSGDDTLGEYGVYVAFREPGCNYYVSEEEDMLLNSELRFEEGKVYGHVENKYIPYGEEVAWTIDKDSIKISSDSIKLVETGAEEKNIVFVAAQEGEATITFDVSAEVQVGEDPVTLTDTIELRRYVTTELYRLSLESSTGTNLLLKDGTLSLVTRLDKGSYTEEGGEIWEEITTDKVEFIPDENSQNEEIISINGTEVTAKNYGDTGIRAVANIPLEGGESYTAESYLDIHVVDRYYQAFAKSVVAEPGQNVKLPISVKYFTEENPAGADVTEFSVEELRFFDGDWFVKSIAQDNRSIVVAAEDMTKEHETGRITGDIKVAVTEENSGYVTYAPLEIIICVHDWKEASRKAASCTENGQFTYKCGKCDSVKTETIKATGHNFGQWVVTKKATALENGVETRTCRNCGKTETRTTEKLKGYIKLNVTSIPLAVKQSTTEVKVVKMAEGDAIASYSSSNKKIATVNGKGKITGKKVGKATITVTLKSGVRASVQVKVQKGAVKLKKLTVDKKKLSLSKGKSYTLQCVKNPVTAKDKVKFTTSNKKVVTVNSKGKITAKKAGKAVVTVSCGSKKVKVNVTVK